MSGGTGGSPAPHPVSRHPGCAAGLSGRTATSLPSALAALARPPRASQRHQAPSADAAQDKGAATGGEGAAQSTRATSWPGLQGPWAAPDPAAPTHLPEDAAGSWRSDSALLALRASGFQALPAPGLGGRHCAGTPPRTRPSQRPTQGRSPEPERAWNRVRPVGSGTRPLAGFLFQNQPEGSGLCFSFLFQEGFGQ